MAILEKLAVLLVTGALWVSIIYFYLVIVIIIILMIIIII
jgi:hypothetical protein